MSSLYSRLISNLYGINQDFGVKMGLENSLRLQRALGFPDRAFSVVHIAGTNGKGSVAHKVATALQAAGYRVGLTTSPHLFTFRERIVVSGVPISESEVEAYLPSLLQMAQDEGIPATFFEIVTLFAFDYFRRCEVDIAVVETGLGGRLDASNIVSPEVCAITSIDLDHTMILGETREAIAREKGGIIKPGVPLVLGPRACGLGLEQMAGELGASVTVAAEGSNYIEENSNIAKQVLEHLAGNRRLPSRAIQTGCSAQPRCRFEPFSFEGVEGILDVAHNRGGMEALLAAAQERYPGRKLCMMAAFSDGRSLEGTLSALSGRLAGLHIMDIDHPRLMVAEEVVSRALALDLPVGYPPLPPGQCLRRVVNQVLDSNELLLVAGSFFAMQALQEAMGLSPPADGVVIAERTATASCVAP